ncbi:uncharacterized protein LOC130655490 isoform X2 [Hydractinia symbiolongicarpus]|uniref:uncharacterized protein LOC130655490 isoform X2 n=1 Tax=Hydractinia symbiolongicarpus TaxID=13093 RepID=UPI00254B0841|nr:uncharacterized protein LOC130655490 isoform X2 [Hydractinia symbiolongicarpus]
MKNAKFEKEEDYCEPSVVKYQVDETDGNIDTTKYQASNSVNYVLPIESFNKFKVILPKSKLELKTIDGTKVIVTRSSTNKNNCLEIENSESTKASSELTNNNLLTRSFYKHPKSSLSILELLTRQRADLSSKLPSIYTNRKTVDPRNYVYCTKTKKFVIDSQTGLISCQNIAGVSVTEKKSDSDEVFVHPDFVLAPISSWLSSTYTKKLLQQYKPISSAVKRVASKVLCSSGRLTLKRLKDDDTKTAGESFQYVILSTKFGSFVQKRNLKVLQSSPVFIDDRGTCFSKETDKFNNMAKVLQQPRKVEEEAALVSLKQMLPAYLDCDVTKASIILHTVIYIKDLEEEIRSLLNENDSKYINSKHDSSLECCDSFMIPSTEHLTYGILYDKDSCRRDPLLPSYTQDQDKCTGVLSPHFSLKCSEVIQSEKLMSFEDLSKTVLNSEKTSSLGTNGDYFDVNLNMVECCHDYLSTNPTSKDIWIMENSWNNEGEIFEDNEKHEERFSSETFVYTDVNLHSSSQTSTAVQSCADSTCEDASSELYPILTNSSGESSLFSSQSNGFVLSPLTSDYLLPARDVNNF